MLLLMGVLFNVIGFIQGLVGFSETSQRSTSLTDLLFFLLVLGEGTVLLWLSVFAQRVKVWPST